IIAIGISRRHRVIYDAGKPPLGQDKNVLRHGLPHVSSVGCGDPPQRMLAPWRRGPIVGAADSALSPATRSRKHVATSIGPISSLSGLLTRVEIGHIRIR